jgi:hypothetical protein
MIIPETIIRNNGVRVTDNKIDTTEKSALAELRIINFLVFKKYKLIAKVIAEAYPIAKALNNSPVGLSEIRFNPSRTLSCATGIIDEICNATRAKFTKLKVIPIKLIVFKVI